MFRMATERRWIWFAMLTVALLGCGSSSGGGTGGAGPTGGSSAGGGAAGTTSSVGGGIGGAAGRMAAGGAGGAAGAAGPSCSARVACSNQDLVCDTDIGVCVECLADSDCAPQHCDVIQHVCVDCLLNSDCSGATPSCSTGHTCGAACNNSGTCPTDTPVCETSSHTCVECLVNADCDPNGFCQADRTCR